MPFPKAKRMKHPLFFGFVLRSRAGRWFEDVRKRVHAESSCMFMYFDIF
jgi:hypothetical protein